MSHADPPDLGAKVAALITLAVALVCVAVIARAVAGDERERRTRDDAEFTNLCRQRCDAVGLEAFEVDLTIRTCMCRPVRR